MRWLTDDATEAKAATTAALERVDGRFPVELYRGEYNTRLLQRRKTRAAVRSRRLPAAATAAAVVAAVPAWVVELTAPEVGFLPAAVGAAGLSAAALTVAGIRAREQLTGAGVRYAAAAAGAVVWVVTSVSVVAVWPGAWPVMLLVLLIASVLVGSPWRRELSTPAGEPGASPAAPAPPARPGVPRSAADEFVARWNQEIGGEV